jgi:hypothetical protein
MNDLYTTSAASAKKNSIENQLERSHAELFDVVVARKDESAMLEPLREQAETGAVPEEELEQVAPAIEEHVEAPRERVLPQGPLHETQESVERPAHVHRVAVGQDPPRVATEEHAHPPSRAVVPSGKVISNVQRPWSG